ncbi:hypothetical protein DAC20_54 [Bacteroides phage DAC20]|nr:hypothetical protein DAC19_55 [Bacteroides phage DAC19]QIG63807.1 hypothetical protein DAC20_54 [Bacteroides phage DAC20]QIG64069.1 hypothetical protein DAC22_55 [Bacteroides phage DAC22]
MEKIKEKLDSQGNIIEVVLVKDNNQEEKIPISSLYKYGYFFVYGTGKIVKVDKVDSSKINELKDKCLDNEVIY